MHSKVKNCSGAATRILCVEWSKYAGLVGSVVGGYGHSTINILHVTSSVLSIVFNC